MRSLNWPALYKDIFTRAWNPKEGWAATALRWHGGGPSCPPPCLLHAELGPVLQLAQMSTSTAQQGAPEHGPLGRGHPSNTGTTQGVFIPELWPDPPWTRLKGAYPCLSRTRPSHSVKTRKNSRENIWSVFHYLVSYYGVKCLDHKSRLIPARGWELRAWEHASYPRNNVLTAGHGHHCLWLQLSATEVLGLWVLIPVFMVHIINRVPFWFDSHPTGRPLSKGHCVRWVWSVCTVGSQLWRESWLCFPGSSRHGPAAHLCNPSLFSWTAVNQARGMGHPASVCSVEPFWCYIIITGPPRVSSSRDEWNLSGHSRSWVNSSP